MPNYPLTPVFPEFEEVFEWLTEREIALIQFERVNDNFDYFISRCQGNINLLVINKNFINELLENVPPLRWMPWLDIFLIDLIDCYNIKKFLNSIPWPYVRKWRDTKKWRLIKEFKNMKSALYMEPIVSKEYPDYLIGVFNDFKIKLLEEYDKIMTLQEEKNRTKQKVEKTLKPKPEKQWSYELKNIEYLNKTDPEDEIKYFFWQVWERVSNISQKNIIKRYILELEKILEDLEKYFSMELTEGTLLELKDLEKKTKELIEIWKNIEKKEVEENIIQNQEVAENREEVVKENIYQNSIYKEMIDYILSGQWLHYQLSSTMNPTYKNSKWDWSFSMKMARPIFYQIDKLFSSWAFDPENFSWQEIVTEMMKSWEQKFEVLIFLNVLKNFEKKWDFIDIFPYFSEAVQKFSETNYYKNDKKENLAQVQLKLKEIEEKYFFLKNIA